MERLRQQKEARDHAAAAERRKAEAMQAAEQAEEEWRRLQANAENLEREEIAQREASGML
jgi:hypothetical protein